MRKVYLRLLPFAVLCYILAYIDRINVSFAALTMRGDLNMSAADFGFAVGTFYWAYFLFEVPSNVIMEKVGARHLDRAHHDHLGHLRDGRPPSSPARPASPSSASCSAWREAGFFPGLILYFTYWFPARHHARIVSGFLVGLPIAVAAGAPISTGLMSLRRPVRACKGWQIMYHRRGHADDRCSASFRYFVMTNKPEQATFLTQPEKDWLTQQARRRAQGQGGGAHLLDVEAMFNPKVLLLALNYLGIVTASLGMLFFIPQIIKSLGTISNMTVGWLTMIPYICGGIALVVWGRISDRMNERRWNLLLACVLSTGRPGHGRPDHGHVVGDGRHVAGGDGLLRLEGPVLRHAADVPERHGAGRRLSPGSTRSAISAASSGRGGSAS